MNQEMLSFCMEKGILLDKGVVNGIESIENLDIARNLLERIEASFKERIITKTFFLNNADRINVFHILIV